MTHKHYWFNRITFAIALVVVVAAGWYVIRNRSQVAISAPAQSPTSAVSSLDIATSSATGPADTLSPNVTQAAGQIHLSVNTKRYTKVQRVEFYVEHNLVGAAFAAPYSVVISQTSLSAGGHSVTAKVYTDDGMAQTAAASFTNTTVSAATDVPASSTDQPVMPKIGTSAQPTIGVPQDIMVTADDDGITANVAWAASSNTAVSYQIWRDGAQVATSTTTSYIDSNLTPGQTYDYQIAAVSSTGQVSPLSTIAAVTIPVTQDTTSSADSAPVTQPAASAAQTQPSVDN